MLVIKLGGSVMSTSLTELNPQFFQFIDWVKKYRGKCVITLGGGKYFRFLRDELVARGIEDQEKLDYVGIKTLNLNCQFAKSLLPDKVTFPKVIDSPELLEKSKQDYEDYQYFICGAWAPGHSSDVDSVQTAINFSSNQILRISEVNYLYDSDPKNNPEAKLINQASWNEYFNIIGHDTKFTSGGSYPIDPVASRLAQKKQIKFYLTSLEKFLDIFSKDTESVDFSKVDGSIIGE